MKLQNFKEIRKGVYTDIKVIHTDMHSRKTGQNGLISSLERILYYFLY